MIEKYCPKCKTNKPIDLFSWKSKAKGTKQNCCKDCHNLWFKQYWIANKDKHRRKVRYVNRIAVIRNKAFIASHVKEHPCVDCGESDPIVLHFDHLRDKFSNVSNMVRNGYGLEKIEKEIEKCEVRCANCHMRKTAKQFNYVK